MPRAQVPYSERRDYYRRIYEEKRAAGLCSRSGCRRPAREGRTLCEVHADKACKTYLRKRMRERLPEDRSGVIQHFSILARQDPLDSETRELLSDVKVLLSTLEGSREDNERMNSMEKRIDEALAKAEVGIRETRGYIQTGEYPDGRLGEVFIRVGKPGSSEALLDQFAIASSIAMQHGAGVEELFCKFTHTNFEPSGVVKDVRGIERCSSVLDLVSRYLINKYGSRDCR